MISGRVLAQRREIGLLKAIGFTPRGVVALLVAEYAALALAAGIAGLIAGDVDRAAAAGADVEPARHADPERASSPRTLLVALALILAAVALFTALPAIRAGRLNTVDALALGRAASRAARREPPGSPRRCICPPPPASASRTRSPSPPARSSPPAR